MKATVAVLFSLAICMLAKAQVVIEPNPSYTNSSEKPLLDEWLDVESLDGRAEPAATINPAEKICFDKKMLLKIATTRGTQFTCVFVNTKIGLVGYTGYTKNRPLCELDVNDPHFNFNIIGLKGTHFNYTNSVYKGTIKHLLVTNATNRQGLVMSAAGAGDVIYRKDVQKEFFGKVKAWEYKANGRLESWMIFGKTQPDKLVMQPQKYLGLSGVGYQYTEQGLFIILQLSGTGAYGFDTEVIQLEDVPTCFNSAIFHIAEENEIPDAIQNTQEAQTRLDERIQENNRSNSPCKAFKDIVMKQQKKEADILTQQLQHIQQGRQQQAVSQQIELEVERLQTQVYGYDESICKKDVSLSKTSSQQSRNRLMEERQCLVDRKAVDIALLEKFKSIKAQYSRQPDKAIKLMIEARKEAYTQMKKCGVPY